jgi:hypothetical protein
MLSNYYYIVMNGGVMHKFLRAVGFGQLKTKKQEEILLRDIIRTPHNRSMVTNPSDNDMLYAEFAKEFAPGIGIKVCGQYDEFDNFYRETYFPYYEGRFDTTEDETYIEKKISRFEYSGLCNDYRLGMSLVFHLINPIEYISNKERQKKEKYRLSCLASTGIVILPTTYSEEILKQMSTVKKNQYVAAYNISLSEDEAQRVALDDLGKYVEIGMRMANKEDVFSIVETSIVPFGLEAELYKILGIIVSVEKYLNPIMGEKVYVMEIFCNDMIFDVCINESDLSGEPLEGRRFRGVVWLQGKLITK